MADVKTLRFALPGAERSARSSAAKSMTIAAACAAIGAAWFTQRGSLLPAPGEWVLVAALTMMFYSTAVAEIQITVRGRIFSLQASDIPLAAAFVMVSPGAALAAKLISAVLLFLTSRNSAQRALYLAGVFTLEVAAGYAVFEALRTRADSLLQACGVAAIATIATGVVIATVASTHLTWQSDKGINPFLLNVHLPGLLFSVLGALGGTVVVLLWDRSEWTLVGAVAVLWVSAIAARERHSSRARMAFLNTFRRNTAQGNLTGDAVLQSLLEQVTYIVHADVTELHVVDDPTVVNQQEIRRGHRLLTAWRLRDGDASGSTRSVSTLIYGFALSENLFGKLVVRKQRVDFGFFSRHDFDILGPLVAHAASQWRGIQLLQSLQQEMTHDSVTGLGNDRYLADHLRDETREGVLANIRCRDLSHLTTAYGLMVARSVMVEWAHRLQQPTSTADAVVVRLSTDTFGVWLPQEAMCDLTELRERLAEPIAVDGLNLTTSNALGYTYTKPGCDPSDAMRQALTACSRAHAEKHATPTAFDERDVDLARERVALTQALRVALDDDLLDIAYQPKVCAWSHRTLGFEALARWHDADRGTIGPNVFIPLAERSGLMPQLSRYIVRQSISDCARWQDHSPGTTVSVNICAADLDDVEFLVFVEGCLRDSGLAPHLLTLELTESQMMADAVRATVASNALRDIGVHISVDDFGTGYSSLAYLRDLPANEAKIDRSFIRFCATDERSRVLVEQIISMLHAMGLVVVAEGVEDLDTVSLLQEAGCDQIQGFHFSKPMPVHSVEEWLMSEAKRVATTP